MAPLVSVIIPTFRRPDLLARALVSVRAQTHRPLEVIVVDDDDDPATAAAVARAFAGADGITTVALRQKNRGPAAARNTGMRAARGIYLQFLDDDDELFADKIAAQVAALEATGADVVSGDWRQGQDLASSRAMKGGGGEDRFAFLAAEGWAPNFAYLVRAEAAAAWDEALEHADDLGFFLGLAAEGRRFLYRPLATGFYRWHRRPRVSAAEAAARTRASMRIAREAERRLRAAGTPTRERLAALLRFWDRIATDAAEDAATHAECRAAIRRLRAETGEAPGLAERLIGDRTRHRLRALGGPANWLRRLVHLALPLSARRAVRRWENRLRGASPPQ